MYKGGGEKSGMPVMSRRWCSGSQLDEKIEERDQQLVHCLGVDPEFKHRQKSGTCVHASDRKKSSEPNHKLKRSFKNWNKNNKSDYKRNGCTKVPHNRRIQQLFHLDDYKCGLL